MYTVKVKLVTSIASQARFSLLSFRYGSAAVVMYRVDRRKRSDTVT